MKTTIDKKYIVQSEDESGEFLWTYELSLNADRPLFCPICGDDKITVNDSDIPHVVYSVVKHHAARITIHKTRYTCRKRHSIYAGTEKYSTLDAENNENLPRFTDEFKRFVINDWVNTGGIISLRKLSEKYGVKKSTIPQWRDELMSFFETELRKIRIRSHFLLATCPSFEGNQNCAMLFYVPHSENRYVFVTFIEDCSPEKLKDFFESHFTKEERDKVEFFGYEIFNKQNEVLASIHNTFPNARMYCNIQWLVLLLKKLVGETEVRRTGYTLPLRIELQQRLLRNQGDFGEMFQTLSEEDVEELSSLMDYIEDEKTKKLAKAYIATANLRDGISQGSLFTRINQSEVVKMRIALRDKRDKGMRFKQAAFSLLYDKSAWATAIREAMNSTWSNSVDNRFTISQFIWTDDIQYRISNDSQIFTTDQVNELPQCEFYNPSAEDECYDDCL